MTSLESKISNDDVIMTSLESMSVNDDVSMSSRNDDVTITSLKSIAEGVGDGNSIKLLVGINRLVVVGSISNMEEETSISTGDDVIMTSLNSNDDVIVIRSSLGSKTDVIDVTSIELSGICIGGGGGGGG